MPQHSVPLPLPIPVSSSPPTTRISSTTIPVGTQHSTVGATPHVGALAGFLADTIHDTHTQLARGRPRTFAVAAAKTKHSYLSRLEECDVRIKACEARDIQLEVLGATSKCLPKLVARFKHARPDDDDEDERDEEVILDACFFPHCTASPGASR